MKRVFIVVRFIEVTILVFSCLAVFAQGEKEDPGGDISASQSGLTGAGEGGNSSTAAKPGRADGLRNPLLGGECRPRYRLRSSDVVEVTFTVAPEFNQTLTGVRRGGAEGIFWIPARSASSCGIEGFLMHTRL
jgi:hypothetical protein